MRDRDTHGFRRANRAYAPYHVRARRPSRVDAASGRPMCNERSPGRDFDCWLTILANLAVVGGIA